MEKYLEQTGSKFLIIRTDGSFHNERFTPLKMNSSKNGINGEQITTDHMNTTITRVCGRTQRRTTKSVLGNCTSDFSNSLMATSLLTVEGLKW